jgi:hypothetical protein
MRPAAFQHRLDHVIGSNAKKPGPDFGRQMPVAQMPGEAGQRMGVLMPDFNKGLRSCLYLEPPPVIELQPISLCHRNSLRKVEEDLLPLIRPQANAPTVALLEVEREDSHSVVRGPVPGRTMN